MPSERSWPKVSTLPDFKTVVPYAPPLSLDELLPSLEEEGVELLKASPPFFSTSSPLPEHARLQPAAAGLGPGGPGPCLLPTMTLPPFLHAVNKFADSNRLR